MKPTLHKYIPLSADDQLSRLKRLLDGWIYFSSPAHFNDPFELSAVEAPPTTEDFEEVLSYVGGEASLLTPSAKRKIYQTLANEINIAARPAVSKDWQNSLGVLCLSSKPDDLLMWAHYANNHTGVCIGFDSGVVPFSSAREVHYSEERPIVRRVELSAAEDERIKRVLLTKSKHWEYEAEWRCIKRPLREDELTYYRNICATHADAEEEVARLLASEGGPGLYEFDSSAIRRIYFSARIDSAIRETVINFLKEAQLAPKLFQMQLDKRHFRLYAEKIR